MKTVRAATAVVRRGDEVLVVRAAEAGAEAAEPSSSASNLGGGPAGDAGGEPTETSEAASAPWGFPTAELHRGETATEACARGVRETLSLEVEQARAFYTIEYNSALDLLFSVECFFCELEDQNAGKPGAATGDPAMVSEGPEAAPPADAEPDSAGSGPAPRPEFRWIARSELPSLAWEPVSGRLAKVIAASDKESDEALVKRRADSRKSMQGNKRADTRPEMLVRQRLREAGLSGYRLQWKKAPGRPDIAYPGRKVAIFVNGCFWHRCPHCKPPVPKRNREFWETKFARNVERDARAVAELEGQGWCVITIWECELKRDRIDATMERVVAQVRAAK